MPIEIICKLMGISQLASLPKIRHNVWQLSGVSIHFQVHRPCFQVVHWNTRVNGANFDINHV